MIDDMREKNDRGCKDFNPANIFWCRMFEGWRDIKACIAAQNHPGNLYSIQGKGKRMHGCKTCSQKNEINYFALPKPTLKKRKLAVAGGFYGRLY